MNSCKLNPNPFVMFLDKPAKGFIKAEIIKYIEENSIEKVNFHTAFANPFSEIPAIDVLCSTRCSI